MFGWFKRWARQRKERQRQIYEFWDGEKNRRIDPGKAWFELWNDAEIPLQSKMAVAYQREDESEVDEEKLTPAQQELHAADLKQKWADKEEARREVLKLVRKVFGVRSFSNETAGLTLGEQETLLTGFLEWMGELKKKQGTSQSQSDSSGTTSSANGSATKKKSASSPT